MIIEFVGDEKLKETIAKYAVIIWFAVGLILHLYHGGLRSIFTLKSLLFFGAGIFLAAVIVGLINYGLHRIFTKMLLSKVRELGISVETRKTILRYRPFLFVIQTAVAIATPWLAYSILY